jgi:peptide-methionine (R)-S-oxide reductase
MVHLSRRQLLGSGAAAIGAIIVTAASPAFAQAGRRFPFALTDAQWRRRLSADAYAVLRHEGTERAGTSPLDREHRRGVFSCAGCGQRLFSSATKFDSGTGWPSFWRPLPAAIGTRTDRSLGTVRTEVHCARCGGHLGHVFNDGPEPTGKRYCMNGVAMRFQPG